MGLCVSKMDDGKTSVTAKKSLKSPKELEQKGSRKSDFKTDSESKISNNQLYEEYIYKGGLYIRSKEYDKALNMYNAAIKLNPGAEIAYVCRGVALRKSGDLKEGMKSFEYVLKTNPDFIPAILAKAYANAKDADNMKSPEFLTVLHQVVQYDAETFDDYIAQSNAYEILGDIKSSIDMARKALEIKPDAIEYFDLADTLSEQGLYEEAEAAYRESLKLKADPVTWYNLGHMLSEQRLYKEAEAAYRESLKLKADKSTYINLGSVYKKTGDYEKAVSCLNEAIKINPNDPLTYANLGQALYWSGDTKKAIDAFNTAFEVYKNPDNQKHLVAGNHKFLSEVFSHEREELLAKFSELSDTQVPNVTIQDPEAKVALNKEADAAKAERKKALDQMPQAFDLKLSDPSIDVNTMLQSVLAKVNESEARISALEERMQAFEDMENYSTNLQATPKLYKYYDGFAYTFTAAYTAAQVTSVGVHSMDTSHLGITAVAAVADAAAPFGGSVISNLIKAGYAMAKTASNKKDASNFSKIAATPADCGKLVLKLSMKLTDPSSQKVDQINHAGDPAVLKSSTAFGLLLCKVKALGDTFSTMLNGQRFDSLEAKMGRDDALKCISSLEGREITILPGESQDHFVDKLYHHVIGDAADFA